MKDIYLLKNLIRYNNKFRIKDESVAEHTSIVALNVLLLHHEYSFNLERALIMALIHDIPEVFITDITHDVKQKYPDLAEILKDKEFLVMKEYFSEYYDIFVEFENSNTLEALIVKLADINSVTLYAENEIKLGNIDYMEDVIKESSKQKESILCKIENYIQHL